MDNTLVNHLTLHCGLRRAEDGLGFASVKEMVEPFEFTFDFPQLAEMDSVKVSPITVGEVLDLHEKLSTRHSVTSRAYNREMFLALVKTNCKPVLSAERLDSLADIDYENLNRFVMSGYSVGERFAYKLEGDDIVKDAYIRLTTRRNLLDVESRSGFTRDTDPQMYQLWVTYLNVHLGSLDEGASFGSQHYSVDALRMLVWGDYMMLWGNLDRPRKDEFKLLTEVLDSPVPTEGGMHVPFSGVATGHAEGDDQGSPRRKTRKDGLSEPARSDG